MDFSDEEGNDGLECSKIKATLYVEGRIKVGLQVNLELILLELQKTFDPAIILGVSLHEELVGLEMFTGLFPPCLQSLKATEYVGETIAEPCIHLNGVIVEINVYQFQDNCDVLRNGAIALQGDITKLPSIVFEGVWEQLVFDDDMRESLIHFMTNMLRFSSMRGPARRSRMNRMILLSGSPGTGKTTLAQALAQKLSIRLSRSFNQTMLIQINATTLLSKYFSESASKIFEIFSSIESMCKTNPRNFVCVLIDEVESLAPSRSSASHRGDLFDAVRATNALLTGFDMVRDLPNMIILCTSNLVGTIDEAFLDRCGRQIVVHRPSQAAMYQILSNGIRELMEDGIILSSKSIPSYRDADHSVTLQPNGTGTVLLHLVDMLSRPSKQRSARFLRQVAEVALADRMKSKTCSLREALQMIFEYVHQQELVATCSELDISEICNTSSVLSKNG